MDFAQIRKLTKLLVIVLAAAALQACALATATPAAAPPLEVVQPMPLMLGINDGPAVPPDVVAHYCAYGREFIVRAPVTSSTDAIAAVDTIAPCGRLHSLWLIEKADTALARQLADFIQSGVRPPPWGVELGNELDLEGLSAQQFAQFVATGRETLRGAGYAGNLLIGGIYTVDDHQPQDFAAYLAPAIAACPDCIVALHWYGDTSSAWLSRVQHLGARVLVTEFGMPSCTPAQDAAQLAYLRDTLTAYARPGNVLGAIVYERNSAPAPCDASDTSHLAHFGLQRPDATWKPADAVFRTEER